MKHGIPGYKLFSLKNHRGTITKLIATNHPGDFFVRPGHSLEELSGIRFEGLRAKGLEVVMMEGQAPEPSESNRETDADEAVQRTSRHQDRLREIDPETIAYEIKGHVQAERERLVRPIIDEEKAKTLRP